VHKGFLPLGSNVNVMQFKSRVRYSPRIDVVRKRSRELKEPAPPEYKHGAHALLAGSAVLGLLGVTRVLPAHSKTRECAGMLRDRADLLNAVGLGAIVDDDHTICPPEGVETRMGTPQAQSP